MLRFKDFIRQVWGNNTEIENMNFVELALGKDLEECREYDVYLKNIADHQIEFDLDDGVVVNYAKFESVATPIK